MTQKPSLRDHCNRGFPPCTSPPSRQRDDPTTPIVAESWQKDRSPVLANNKADTEHNRISGPAHSERISPP
jgi:hypothetical protein